MRVWLSALAGWLAVGSLTAAARSGQSAGLPAARPAVQVSSSGTWIMSAAVACVCVCNCAVGCCSDADLSLAASNILKGGFSYSGQRCTAVKVVLVLEDVADELVKKVGRCGGAVRSEGEGLRFRGKLYAPHGLAK